MKEHSVMLREAEKAKNSFSIASLLVSFGIVLAAFAVAQSAILMIGAFTDRAMLEEMRAGDATAMENVLMKWTSETTGGLLLQLFTTIAEIAAPIVFCLCFEKRSLASMGFRKEKAVRSYLVGYVAGAALILLAGGIAVWTDSLTITRVTDVSYPLVFLFFAGFLVQGMAEEVLVRGFLLVSLTRKVSVVWAVVISSLVFAALHLGNPGITVLTFVNLVLAGVVFGLCFLLTDNIWAAGAMHSAWNFVQGSIVGVEVSGLKGMECVFVGTLKNNEWINGGSFGLEGGLCVTIVEVLAIAVMLLLIQRKHKKQLEKAEDGKIIIKH
ncbi:MAG: CPBP family intramembrane metalloprotease [Lachnospiraceae bacterium]|nr:CPBP family intramembrane metalloprotease [Lachnospiraceae bacterium]